jgi:hypothetical protein
MEVYIMAQDAGTEWRSSIGKCAIFLILGGGLIMIVAKVMARVNGILAIDTKGGAAGLALTLMGFLCIPAFVAYVPFRDDTDTLLLLDRMVWVAMLSFGVGIGLMYGLIRRWRKRVHHRLFAQKPRQLG